MSKKHAVFVAVGALLSVVFSATALAATLKQSAPKPIVIGMINQENSPAGSFPEQSQGAKAAVNYINTSLHGVQGHPIKLVLCTDVGTPESASSCANKLVALKPLLVTSGTDFGTAASIPIFTASGIPYVGGVPLLTPELTSKNAFFFVGGSAAAFPGQDVYIAQDMKAKKVVIIYTDNEPGLAAAQVFSKNILVGLGLDANNIKLIPEKADAADFTPSMSAAKAANPDAIMILFAAQGCSRAMQAKQSLGVTAAMFYPGSCMDVSVLKAGGAGAQGAYFNSETLLFNQLSNPQVRLYRKQLAAYAGSKQIVSMYSQSTFGGMMNIYAIMKQVGYGKLTTKNVVAALKAAKNKPSFMMHSYSCDGTAAPFPSVCNANVRIVQYTNGAFKDVGKKWISGANLVKLG